MEDNTLICEFTNTVHRSATLELLDFLAEQSAPKPISEVHDRQETPLFAGVERHDSSRLRPLQRDAFDNAIQIIAIGGLRIAI